MQTTSIFFLAISPLISRSAALTAALMCLVHKHLAQQQPLFSFCFMNSLMPLALPPVRGSGKKKVKKKGVEELRQTIWVLSSLRERGLFSERGTRLHPFTFWPLLLLLVTN